VSMQADVGHASKIPSTSSRPYVSRPLLNVRCVGRGPALPPQWEESRSRRYRVLELDEIMEIKTIRVVCFSPTGTSRTVARAIVRGLDPNPVEWTDITVPQARTGPFRTPEDDLLVVAVPVYMGRVPALLGHWLRRIVARDTPTVCVVVYGNRAFDDALLELRDILTGRGCKVLACAAFIGEHSFSDPETPIAHGRPDADDLEQAEVFGRRISDTLRSLSSVHQMPEIHVPGNRPYGGVTELWSLDFIAVSDDCIECGVCAEVCPVGAIDPRDSRHIDKELCITCCACLKSCPESARTMKAGPVMDVAKRLNELHGERKEPVFFL